MTEMAKIAPEFAAFPLLDCFPLCHNPAELLRYPVIMKKPAPHPYAALPPHAFWRTGVAEAGVYGLQGLWSSPWDLPADARFATFGSCFAQHISRALKERRMGWIDGEPAPAACPPELARQFNYGVFSARTANIYTAAQLHLLMQMVAGQVPLDGPEIWADPDGRFRDSLRPAIEPDGFASRAEALLSRQAMLRGLRRAVTGADVFVFTLGLTEGWESESGQPYAACPGTMGGQFDADRHHFVNYRSTAIRNALDQTLALMRGLNPALHLLLTVSPVPLTATASGGHVLVATTRSKSVLRAVGGEMAEGFVEVDFFPGYEMIRGGPTRLAFFEPNLRSVVRQGVDTVMGHFFAGLRLGAPARHGAEAEADAARDRAMQDAMADEALVCEEAALEAYNAS